MTGVRAYGQGAIPSLRPSCFAGSGAAGGGRGGGTDDGCAQRVQHAVGVCDNLNEAGAERGVDELLTLQGSGGHLMATTPRRLFAAQQLQARVRTAAQSGRYEAVRRAQSARDVAAVALRSASKMLKLSLEARARARLRGREPREHTQPGSCASGPPAAHADDLARATSVTQARGAATDALTTLDSHESHPRRPRLKSATGAATAYLLLSRGSDPSNPIERLWTPRPSLGEAGNGGGRRHSLAALPAQRRSYPPCSSLEPAVRTSLHVTPGITSGAQASRASTSAVAAEDQGLMPLFHRHPFSVQRTTSLPAGMSRTGPRSGGSQPELGMHKVLRPPGEAFARASSTAHDRCDAHRLAVYCEVGAEHRQSRREFPSTLALPRDRLAQMSRHRQLEREDLPGSARISRALSAAGHFRQRHLSARNMRT